MFRPLALVSVLLAGCLDYGAAYERCKDAGRCDVMPTDGGAGGGSTGGGGGGGGGGTGGGGTEGYDGGPSCNGSTRPHLRCDAPRVVADGAIYQLPQLVPFHAGLLAGWSGATSIEIRELDSSGTVTRQVLSEPTSGVVKSFSLAAEGDVWGAAYNTGMGSPISCFSSFGDAGIDVGTAGPNFSTAVAASEDGGIAVVSGDNRRLGFSIGTRGCPASPQRFDAGNDFDYVNLLRVPNMGAGGFVYAYTDQPNGFSHILAIGKIESNGSLFEQGYSNTEGVSRGIASAINVEKTRVMTAYRYAPGGGSDEHLGIRGFEANFNVPMAQHHHLIDDVKTFSISNCGSGCIATAWTILGSPGQVGVHLTNDGLNPVARGGLDAGWDVQCSTVTAVAVAFTGGRLRFLIAQPANLTLLSCDLPP